MKLKIKDKKHTIYIFESVERYSFIAQDLIILFYDYTYSSMPSDDILTLEKLSEDEDIY